MGGQPHQPLLPAQPVLQGTALLGRGEEPASYLFAPAFHRVKQPDFAANPGGGLASGTGDEDAANTFGDAPGTGPNPSPKRRKWPGSPGVSPGDGGQRMGTAPLAWDFSGAFAGLSRLLSAGRSLHLVAEPRTTDGLRGRGGGGQAEGRGLGQCCHLGG